MCKPDRGSRRALRVESLERRRLFAGDLGTSTPEPIPQDAPPVAVAPVEESNPGRLHGDVNGDSRVSAADVLAIVNRLNVTIDVEAEQVDTQNEEDPHDVNLDGLVSAADALIIINQLNEDPVDDVSGEPIVLVVEAFSYNQTPPCTCGGIGCPACVGAAFQTHVADASHLETLNSIDVSAAEATVEVA